MSQFLSEPELVPLADGRNWRLVDMLTFVRTDGVVINVPPGFITDLASVPQIFWNILPPFGKYDSAAIVHDFLYRNHGSTDPGDLMVRPYTRAECDAVLLEAMAELGTPLWARWTIYLNVRAFGWLAWNHEPAQAGSGERKVSGQVVTPLIVICALITLAVIAAIVLHKLP